MAMYLKHIMVGSVPSLPHPQVRKADYRYSLNEVAAEHNESRQQITSRD